MKEESFSPYQAVFGSYKGKKIFEVTHPAFGTCRVSAPDADSSIVAAAEFWHQEWTRLDFYSNCTVIRIL